MDWQFINKHYLFGAVCLVSSVLDPAPFQGIGKLGGRLERHQLEGVPMSPRTDTTF